jgi:hypothetical protein
MKIAIFQFNFMEFPSKFLVVNIILNSLVSFAFSEFSQKREGAEWEYKTRNF